MTMVDGVHGEAGPHFRGKLLELAATIMNMPRTYEQDGKGDEAVAHLHYFKGSGDWYITEKDVDTDGAGQIQAFGLVKLWETELGYISIAELIQNGVELDLHFTPTTLGELKKVLEKA